MSKATRNPALLRRLLQQELALGKRLLTLGEAETEAIIANDIARLNQINAEQQACLEQQRALDKAREAAARDLAWGLGWERVPPFTELLTRLPEREQSALSDLRLQLLAVQGQLETGNARNRLLLDRALDYVQFSLELLTSVALQPARYGTNLATLATPAFYIDSKA